MKLGASCVAFVVAVGLSSPAAADSRDDQFLGLLAQAGIPANDVLFEVVPAAHNVWCRPRRRNITCDGGGPAVKLRLRPRPRHRFQLVSTFDDPVRQGRGDRVLPAAHSAPAVTVVR